MRSVSRMSQSSKWSQLRTIYKMWINSSFMLWRNRTLKRLSSISHQTKRPGMIEYPAKVFKDSLPTTLPVITHLINSLFASNCFAQTWKSAVIIPNLKSGDPDEPENTRPISLLPIMWKVCEKAAHTQFMDFLDKNSKVFGLHSWNRKFHYTETALLHYTDHLLKNMAEKRISVVVLLDMSKAFDSIQHDNLLSKLHLLGVLASALVWFKSYLSLRKQVVRIGSDLSDPLPLTVGVAQGSILGPVLFTSYVNDLLSVPKKCVARGYVDDTKLFLTLPPTCVAISDLNSDLREIAKWCSTNSLLINPNKTKLLVVGVPQLTRNLYLPPVFLIREEHQALSRCKRLGDLDRLCRNFRRPCI